MSAERKKLIQYIGGGLIVVCAFGIMLPGLLAYLASLWRIISLIGTMVIVAWLIVYIYHKLRPSQKSKTVHTSNNGGSQKSSPADESTKQEESTGE